MNPYAHIPKNFDTLEVGEWYMDRKGRIRECVFYDPDGSEDCKFETEGGYSYCINGMYLPNDAGESPFDLTHRVNPDGSLWMGEAPKPTEAPKATPTKACGITVRSVTLELAQTLPSGEEQTLIVEVTDTDEIISADPAWTNGAITIADIMDTADSCLAHAKLRIAAIAEGVV